MEDFDKYLDRLVENFYDTGKLVLNEGKLTDDELSDIAKLYDTNKQWKESDRNSNAQAYERNKKFPGFLDKIRSHMVPHRKSLSDDELADIAKLYDTPEQWKESDRNSSAQAYERNKKFPGFLDKIRSHMVPHRKSLSDDELGDVVKKYEDTFLVLGFKKVSKGGRESIIHNLHSKGFSLVNKIKDPNEGVEEISEFIINNIINYVKDTKDIIKFDLTSSEEKVDINGNVIIPKDSKIEVKNKNLSDSYLSEFLASPVKSKEYGIITDDGYEQKYSNVIQTVYKWLSEDKVGMGVKNTIKYLLLNDLEGMIVANNVFIPKKDGNIEFYLSNVGHNNPESHLRIVIRYHINLGNWKNFYRIGDGIWEITEGEKSEKGVMYPLTDETLLTYRERKIHSEDDNTLDGIVEEFYDTGKVVLNEQETEEKCLNYRCEDMGKYDDHSHVFINGCVKRLCDTGINTDKGLTNFNKIIFNISRRIRGGEIPTPITFELYPSSVIVNGEKTYYIYKDHFEMKKINGEFVPYFPIEKLEELIEKDKFNEYFGDTNYVKFKGLYDKIKNYNHNHDPTIGTEEGKKRSKILREYSDILARYNNLSTAQLKRAYDYLEVLYGLGYPPVEKDNIPADPPVSLSDVQSDTRWGVRGEWYNKNKKVIGDTLKEVYKGTDNWLSKEDAERHNVAQGVINVGEPAVGGEDYGWSILNFFNTNSGIREKLVKEYFEKTTPNEFNIDNYIEWVENNGISLFSNLDGNDLLKNMIRLNLFTWKSGQGHEVNTVDKLKEILDDVNWEIIYNGKPGTLKDMQYGVDIEIKNKKTENVYGIQVKPLTKKLNGNVVHTKGAKSYNTNKVHFWVFMDHKTDYGIFVNDGKEKISNNLKYPSGGRYDKIEFDTNKMSNQEFIEKLDTLQQNESTDRIDNIIENFFDTGNFDI